MSLADIAGLQCVVCGRMYGFDVEGTCTQCGPDGILDVRFEYRRIRESLRATPLATREQSLWRYVDLLPVDSALPRPPFQIGATPLLFAPRLAASLGIQKLLIKNEGANPSGSVKDRSSAMAVIKALEKGMKTVACASTGDSASSMSALAAAVGLRAYVFLPEKCPESDLVQSLLFGATVIRVKGNYTETVRLCDQACSEWGWYSGNHATNPYLIEGEKTLGHEIAEATQNEVPDWVVVPVGDGCTVAAVWKGIQEMHHLGILPRRPRMLGVQARQVAPIAAAFRGAKEIEPQEGDTIADSIRVSRPADWRRALRAVRDSEGDFVTVSDEDIFEGLHVTARLAGASVGLAGGAAVAGLRGAVQERVISSRDSVLVVVTANGLKNVPEARNLVETPIEVEPDLGKIELQLARRRARRA
jgi:threonine synthase